MCDFCKEGHVHSECDAEGEAKEVNYIGNYQRGNLFSNTSNDARKEHSNRKWKNNFALNPTQGPPQNP
ncbi:hypothetical protein MtrunA17_Chr4g0070261 [Medicago truncatula]|uniref:Uncharacterized protein n=1 Tax=Medicago truncatula TaxID=3880 RepID=A0A396II83_MEDTR|nr:hypothetical protein MtrunA17_Chr4g0070261 [Medicago truncatula]